MRCNDKHNRPPRWFSSLANLEPYHIFLSSLCMFMRVLLNKLLLGCHYLMCVSILLNIIFYGPMGRFQLELNWNYLFHPRPIQ